MNQPVLIGVAHVDQRISDLESAKEPLALMIEAVNKAADDAGINTTELQSVRVVRGMWPYSDPGRVVADAVGAANAQTGISPYGGNFVQSFVNATAVDIQNGEFDLVVITGAECGNTQAKAAKAGTDLGWQEAPGSPDLQFGQDMEMRHDAEKAIRLGRPIQVYPIFETALRHHQGLGVDDHMENVSELWASFSRVAADNPNAWIREAKTAEEIRTPSAVNRPVSFPYPKFMNSNNAVDQGAALILATEEKAQALGVPREKWIYPWAGTDGHDHYFVSNRDTLYGSPAIRIAGQRCMDLAGVTVSDLAHVDVYSCFPSAVQVAARELNLDTSKPLTVTGGLTWAGGPLNNYVMHSIVRMAEVLRDDQGEVGLITANGGYLTKHAFGIYSSAPPQQPFQHEDLQEQIDATPFREVASDFNGSAEVEGYSVMYGASGLEKAFLACRTDDDKRTWAITQDPDTLAAMVQEEFCGRTAHISSAQASF